MSAISSSLDEAREHLRVIRQTMERSTQYSTLSGWSGILIGVVALVGVGLTQRLIAGAIASRQPVRSVHPQLGAIWLAALVLAVSIDFLCNKRRAVRVGKRVVSRLGAHIIIAALPAFLACGVLTIFFYQHDLISCIWGIWMLCYGLAICAVGLFSVRYVSYLGAAFVVAGALTLLIPVKLHLLMMAVTFGGFHIVYGVAMARRHGW
ncbi:MAG: hypothetical protein ACLQVD_03185 [Capsulimonadaceae bacterium]